MSIVKIDPNGKGGFACSWSIDLEIGCRNSCKGCYGSKTTYMSNGYFTNIKSKEYDEKKFRSSCRAAFKKDVRYVRFSKHSDSASGHLLENFKSVLKVAGEEGLKLIVVSKSLTYNQEVFNLMKKYGHILHMSLGMIGQAPSDMDRARVFSRYYLCSAGVNAFKRITADVTRPCEIEPGRFHINTGLDTPHIIGTLHDRCIVTPMRFASKEIAAEYGADLSKYKYVNGYYRPIGEYVHESWKPFKNWCGEVLWATDGYKADVRCCKCGVK